MSEPLKHPTVGITLMIINDDRILLSRRRGSHGEGEYGTPGGHLEIGETYEACALRELAEECGPRIRISTPRFLCLTNLRDYLPKHYADVGMLAHHLGGEPETMEPEKCEGWDWHPLSELPTPLFGAIENLVIAYQTGQPYFA